MEASKGKAKADPYKQRVDALCEKFKDGRLVGSMASAKATAEMVKLLVKIGRYSDAETLIERLKELGRTLQAANPEQVAITNLILRVLHLIRTEQTMDEPTSDEPPARDSSGPSPPLRNFNRVVSLSNILEQPLASPTNLPTPISEHEGDAEPSSAAAVDPSSAAPARPKKPTQWPGKEALLESLEELFAELDGVETQIASHAVEHILSKEIILTFGFSQTILQVLKEAKQKLRDFTVFVVVQQPHHSGHEMAMQLTAAGIQTELITDSNVYTAMGRVDKVLVGTHAFLANGSILGALGLRCVAEAALFHAAPLIAFGGLHKLTPIFPTSVTTPSMPTHHCDFHPALLAGAEGLEPGTLAARSTMFDYVPADRITMLITDIGGITPAHVPLLLADYYCREDFPQQQPSKPATRAGRAAGAPGA